MNSSSNQNQLFNNNNKWKSFPCTKKNGTCKDDIQSIEKSKNQYWDNDERDCHKIKLDDKEDKKNESFEDDIEYDDYYDYDDDYTSDIDYELVTKNDNSNNNENEYEDNQELNSNVIDDQIYKVSLYS